MNKDSNSKIVISKVGGPQLTCGYIRLLMPSSGLMSRPHRPPSPARWAIKLAGGSTRPARTVRLGVPRI